MIRSNYSVYMTPQFRVLSDKQVEEIHLATMELLQRTGVDVYNKKALKLLKEAGCLVKGNRVRFPSDLVMRCINSAPERISIYNREGKPAMTLEDHKVYFGTGSDTPYVMDPFTNERRKTVNEDIARSNRIADYLENIDFCMSLGIASDYPEDIVDVIQLHTQITNTTKPIVFVVQETRNLNYCIEMAAAVAGGEEELRLKPFIIHYSEPTTPLAHPEDSIDRLMICAEKRIPLIYTPGVQAGATGPVTIAGAMVCGNAEILSGLVIHQLVNPGAPFIHGGVVTIMDMQKANYSLGGSPEWYLANAAMKELSYYYKIPLFGTAGCTDAKVFDQQAAIEIGQNIMVAAMCGANLVHDVGYMECGLSSSWEMVVVANEIIGQVKRFMRGIRVDEETLALDVLDRIGPGGHFLGDEHTFKLFKEEHWAPKLFDRSYYNTWKMNGGLTLREKAREVVKQILENHTVPDLPQNVLNELKRILERAKKT
ncbi:MAG: trimethylamine---corrinoid protein Co-methyltransferase [Clostridia bacterium]|nr:trimethylamine---corrinoid protein Co-methyltransferase [Clostridia bacterium]